MEKLASAVTPTTALKQQLFQKCFSFFGGGEAELRRICKHSACLFLDPPKALLRIYSHKGIFLPCSQENVPKCGAAEARMRQCFPSLLSGLFALYFSMICNGNFLFWPFLVLCSVCIYMGKSFLCFGKFSSMILSKIWSDFSLIYACN